MITFTHVDLSVHTHRQWRASGTSRTPVLAIGPDTRRLTMLLAALLQAMGVALPEGRWGFSREWLLRWWTAWSHVLQPERFIIFGAYSASAPALCELLVLMKDQGHTCELVLPDGESLRHSAVLEEVDAVQVESLPLSPPSLDDCDVEPGEQIPSPPECSTAYFLEAALNVLTTEAERLQVTSLYTQVLRRTFAVLDLEAEPETLLRILYSEAAQARSNAHLTVALHAIQAGCWSAGVPAELHPPRLMRLSGPTLRARANASLWRRCCYQADAQRGLVAAMVTLGASVDVLLSLDLGTASDWLSACPWSPLPTPVRDALAACIEARQLDGALTTDLLLRNPEQPNPTRSSMSRCCRLAVEEHLTPTLGHRRPWQGLTAQEQLHELGVEWLA